MFRKFRAAASCSLVAGSLVLAAGHVARASDTELAAVASDGSQANAASGGGRITPDGRFVVFTSGATNLAAGEGSSTDVWVRDRLLNTTTKISVPDPSMPQVLAGAGSSLAHNGARVISDDGRFVVFTSFADNLVASDTNDVQDVFVRDRDFDNDGVFDEAGAGQTRTVRVSLTSTEGQSFGSCPNQTCTHGASGGTISANGRYVAFVSEFNFAGSEAFTNIYRRDRDADNDGVFDETINSPVNAAITELVTPSISCGGCDHNGFTDKPAISGDGRHIAFVSNSSRQVFSDFNNAVDVFVRDMQGDTYRMSQRIDGGEGEPSADSDNPSISFDGRFVAFQSSNDDLDPADNQNLTDIFVRDRDADDDNVLDEAAAGAQSLERVSKGRSAFPFPGGSIVPLNDGSFAPSISDDGRYVAFHSAATNNSCGVLDCVDTNGLTDVFVHDRNSTTTTLVPISTQPSTVGAQGNGNSTGGAVSADGRFVVFNTAATNFVTIDDTGTSGDVYVRALRNDTNINCSTILAASAGTYFGDTWAAGNEGDSTCGGNDSPDVWYVYTATCNGLVTFDTQGSSFDTMLSVHSACPGTAANQIACNDDIAGSANRNSRVTISVAVGQFYVVRVAGFGLNSGFYALNISECDSCCPGNADQLTPGSVNFTDITTVLANFGNAYPGPSGAGDANCDTAVNFTDITTVLANFGNVCN
jgi:hypothetical protein